MNRLAITLCGLILAALPSTSALADTVYTYTGNHFNGFGANDQPQVYTTGDFVSGEFTLSAPLGDNAPITTITPVSFSFSDGVQTINNLNATTPLIITVGTNAGGDISVWGLQASAHDGALYLITTENRPPYETNIFDNGAVLGSHLAYANGYINGSPGTWTVSTTDSPSPVPEPSSLFLLGTGAIGGLGVFRRKLVR